MRDDLRTDGVEPGADPQAVLGCAETGFLNTGTQSVGVPRQSSGTAGHIDNGQLGVLLAYASPQGRTFSARELYLPQRWAEDGGRRRAAGGPDKVTCATKPQLAQRRFTPALLTQAYLRHSASRL